MKNNIKVKTVSPICWRFSKPKHFPCHLCDRNAENVVVVIWNAAEVTLYLCGACSGLDAKTLIEKIRTY